MYRSALRSTPRAVAALRQTTLTTGAGRRFASTVPANKRRGWKSFVVRTGLVVGAVYWYNTSPIFADELQPQHVAPPPRFSDDDLPTVEAVVEKKRKEAEARMARAKAATENDRPAPAQGTDSAAAEPTKVPAKQEEQPPSGQGSPADLEAEAGQQGAFNPETGEINWDCPCLGGMANGPCGEEFKAAFSCFVYSTEEPKGMDCIDNFQHMQDCFRKHPEVYGEELADDEDDEASGDAAPEAGAATAQAASEKVDTTTADSKPSPASTPIPSADNVSPNLKPAAVHDTLSASSADRKAPETTVQK